MMLILFSFLLQSFVFVGVGIDAPLQEHNVNITVTNIKTGSGTMMIAVYENEDSFLSEDLYKGFEIKVEATGELQTSFNLAPGVYAISIFHDVNNNGKLDSNFFGLPKEPYGFSNNARGVLGPPSFEKASFKMDNELKKIEVKL